MTAIGLAPGTPRTAATLPGDGRATLSPRTRRLLHGPILPTLLLMAWPNILVMLAQASTGLIETWWIAFLGTDALAGMALVFPGFMMMQMLSAGAIGGGISSAIARALGGGRRADADALVLHALIVNGAARASASRRRSCCSGRRSIARWAARRARWMPRCNIRTWCSPATCWSG